MNQKNKILNSSSFKIISVSGPSGVGKSSFINKILTEFSILKTTVTYTTRKKRKQEFEGKSYFYISQKKFLELTKKDFFVEWAKVHSFYYGTEKNQIEQAWEEKKYVIVDVDIQGAFALKKKYNQILSVFIKPRSLDDLRQRIKERDGEENKKDLELRMKNAKKEMEMSKFFDIVIENDNFKDSYKLFKKTIDKYIKKR